MKFFNPIALKIALFNVLVASAKSHTEGAADEALASTALENARLTVAAYQKQVFHTHALKAQGRHLRNLQEECGLDDLGDWLPSPEAELEFLQFVSSAKEANDGTLDFSELTTFIAEAEKECKERDGIMYFLTAKLDPHAVCNNEDINKEIAFSNSFGIEVTSLKNWPICITKGCNENAVNAFFAAGGEECLETFKITPLNGDQNDDPNDDPNDDQNDDPNDDQNDDPNGDPTSGVSGLVPEALSVAFGATLALVSMFIM